MFSAFCCDKKIGGGDVKRYGPHQGHDEFCAGQQRYTSLKAATRDGCLISVKHLAGRVKADVDVDTAFRSACRNGHLRVARPLYLR